MCVKNVYSNVKPLPASDKKTITISIDASGNISYLSDASLAIRQLEDMIWGAFDKFMQPPADIQKEIEKAFK